MTLDQYEAEMERVNNMQYERLIERREIKMREEEFNTLMEEFNDEIEAIAGQPDPHAELTYGEMQTVRKNSIAADAFESAKVKAMDSVLEIELPRVVDKAVHQPSHYQVADTNVNDMLAKLLTHEELMGWLKGNIIKYRMRAFKKGKVGPQDIAKSNWYQTFYDEYVAENTK